MACMLHHPSNTSLHVTSYLQTSSPGAEGNRMINFSIMYEQNMVPLLVHLHQLLLKIIGSIKFEITVLRKILIIFWIQTTRILKNINISCHFVGLNKISFLIFRREWASKVAIAIYRTKQPNWRLKENLVKLESFIQCIKVCRIQKRYRSRVRNSFPAQNHQ